MVKVKCTLVQALRLCTGRTTHRGSRCIALPFLDQRNQKGVWDQCPASAAFYPRERPGTYCTGGWVDPRAGLDRRGKSHAPPGFDPRTVQPVANRYTDQATRPTLQNLISYILPLALSYICPSVKQILLVYYVEQKINCKFILCICEFQTNQCFYSQLTPYFHI